MTTVLAQVPTATPAEQLAHGARTAAINLTIRVRLDDPATVWAHLAELTPEQLYATTVMLAAMVPLNASPYELLAWLDDPEPERAIARDRATIRAGRDIGEETTA